MTPPQIAYLGPPASFSHSAALNFLSSCTPSHPTSSPNGTSDSALASPSVHAYSSFPAIFSALQSSSPSPSSPLITQAIVPIENSSNGAVVGVLDLLADPRNQYPDLRVCAEYYLPVHHYFLVRAGGEGSTGERIARVKRVHTHPQVWGQCVRFLEERCRGVERVDMGSTSLAAGFVGAVEEEEEGLAAIGSLLAAEANGLEVLAEEIEDEKDNTTRFLVLYKAPPSRERGSLSSAEVGLGLNPAFQRALHGRQVRHKSLISFTLNHERPGSLADALAVFRTFGFNLTSVDTRPSRERHWHYIFLVECEEVREVGNDANLWEMLARLEAVAERCRFLGCWVDALEGR